MLKVLAAFSFLAGYASATKCAAIHDGSDLVPIGVCWVESNDGAATPNIVSKKYVCADGASSAAATVTLNTYATADCSETTPVSSATAESCNQADDHCYCGTDVAACSMMRSQLNTVCAVDTAFSMGVIQMLGCWEGKDGSSTNFICLNPSYATAAGLPWYNMYYAMAVQGGDYTDKECATKETYAPTPAPVGTDQPTMSPIPSAAPTTPPPTVACYVRTRADIACSDDANAIFSSMLLLFMPFVFMFGY